MNLTDYAKKFSGAVTEETKARNAVITAVKEILGVDLERSKIRISKEVVYITGSSALRSEVNIKQGKLLANIKMLDPELKIKKIQ